MTENTVPYREFLETYPLFRKYHFAPGDHGLNFPALVLACPVCGSAQPFTSERTLQQFTRVKESKRSSATSVGPLFLVSFVCNTCQQALQYFFLYWESGKYIMKLGQYPPWELALDPKLQARLGPFAAYYREGLACEAQGYGIAAFAYYRRVIEGVIDQLLQDVSDLIPPEDQEAYRDALRTVHRTKVTEKKIAVVRDLLPPILRPDNVNPLTILHTALSAGLHGETDEACLEQAMGIRAALLFLVQQLNLAHASAQEFTDHMRRMLERQNKRNASAAPETDALPI